MRTWLHRHPNIATLLCAAMATYSGVKTTTSENMAVVVPAALSWVCWLGWMLVWWRKT